MRFGAPAALLALAALAGSGAASAAPRLPEISGDQAAALAVYAVPDLIAATRQTCAGQLAPDGFFARRGDALAQRYATQQAATWPMARAAMLKIAGGQAADQLKTFGTLPDQAVRPLVDALIQQEAAARIHPGSCRNIERLAEALSPLEPAQTGKILAAMFDIAAQGDKLLARLDNRPAKP